MKKNWYKANLSRINSYTHELIRIDNEKRGGLIYRNKWNKPFCFAVQQIKEAVCAEERLTAFNAKVEERMAGRAKLSKAEAEAKDADDLAGSVRKYYQEKDAAMRPAVVASLPQLERSREAVALGLTEQEYINARLWASHLNISVENYIKQSATEEAREMMTEQGRLDKEWELYCQRKNAESVRCMDSSRRHYSSR
jgi:hypothetical protein